MTTNRIILGAMAALALAAAVSCQSGSSDVASVSLESLKEGFANPPQEAKPQVWWHWMDGNISKDGIKKDLEWMHESGVGGFHHFDAGLNTRQIVENRLIYMHDDWKDAFKYAIHIADSLGMDMTIASSPGWSCMGGPWVKPENGMKKIVWREVRVAGGQQVEVTLPEGYSVAGNFQNNASGEIKESYYQDIAVLAVKLADNDKTLAELGAKVTTSAGSAEASLDALTDSDFSTSAKLYGVKQGLPYIQYEFPEAQSFRSVTVADGRTRGQWANEEADWSTVLSCSNDGVNFTEVAKIPSSNSGEMTVTFDDAVSAKYFRLNIANPVPSLGQYAQIAAMMGYSMPGATGPASTDIYEFNLSTVAKVNHAEEKAGYAAPHDLYDFPTTSNVGAVATEVVDLTSSVKDGKLSWNAPEGNWKIYRIGYSLTGKENSPAPAEATGLEVDKLDLKAFGDYFREYFDMYVEASGNMFGSKGIQNILTDSYEAGQNNWTPNMFNEFKTRRGYDLLPWLPALTGEVIESIEKTEGFLFDYRMTMGELMAENYDQISVIAKEYGLKGRWSESHENGRVYVVDGMDVKRTSMIPMAAIWMPHPMNSGSKVPMAKSDIREAASVAHVYGQNFVAAESLTSTGFGGQAYSFCPENLKPIVDIEFANGLNRLVVHESAHQPSDDHVPGLGLMIFGQWFNRHDSWAPLAKYWMDYVARSSFMLQQGKYSADILYYYGEDSNIQAQYGFELPDTPKGYAFDFVNPTAVKTVLEVKNGKIVSNISGIQYSVLVLDKNTDHMSVEILKALKKLADKGAVIVGDAPKTKSGNVGTQEEFDSLVKDIFSSGRKNVMTDLNKALASTPKDYITTADLAFVHRNLGDKQIWWVSNPSAEAVSAEVSLNVTGLKPQLWNAETGEISDVTFRIDNGRTCVSLDLEGNDAKFIVFAQKTEENSGLVSTKEETSLCEVAGPWNVSFQHKLYSPRDITLDKLVSLSENKDKDVKYFGGGTATYTNTFEYVSDGGKAILDLGSVKNLAEVTVNGQKVAVLWKAPFKCDISEAVKEGTNTLEVKVTCLWPNRLIGDAQPGAKPITYIGMAFYTANDQLSQTGLLGPVEIKSEK